MFGENIANLRTKTMAKLKRYDLYRWIELTMKNSKPKTTVPLKATQSTQTLNPNLSLIMIS